MKKTIFALTIVFAIIYLFPVSVRAEGNSDYNDAYSVIDGEELKEFLDESYVDYYGKNNIDLKDTEWVNKVTVSNFLSEIVSEIKNNSLKPIRVFFSLMSVILLTAALNVGESRSGASKAAVLTAVSVISLVVLSDIWGLISSLQTAVRTVCRIVLVFVPVFETALALSGRITTAAASSGILLAATEALSLVATDYIMPIMGGYSALAVASSLTPFSFVKQLGETIKKASLIVLSAMLSVFVGIIGLQTTVNSAADNLAIKTTKFIMGTFVPIGGGTLGEAANTIYSSMSLIKSSVGIYAVLSIVIICLPVIIMTILFKLVFSLSSVVSQTFSQTEISNLILAVNSLLSVVLSIVLFFGGVFVFSIALVLCLTNGG